MVDFTSDFSTLSQSSNLKIYTSAAIYVNNSILTEETEIQITRNTNSQSMYTVGIGYAGEAGGPLEVEFSVNNAVPAVGFEMDPGRFMGVLQEIAFSIFAGNKIMNFNGFITSDNFTHAVNTVSNLSFKGKGTFSHWSA